MCWCDGEWKWAMRKKVYKEVEERNVCFVRFYLILRCSDKAKKISWWRLRGKFHDRITLIRKVIRCRHWWEISLLKGKREISWKDWGIEWGEIICKVNVDFDCDIHDEEFVVDELMMRSSRKGLKLSLFLLLSADI